MSGGLKSVYGLTSTDEARDFYDTWAAGYEEELAEAGYVTPMRAAAALAQFASLPWAPLIEFGCGTGLGGLALRAAGFECLDGFDISAEMLARAEEKQGLYRALGTVDLSQPLDDLPEDEYQNAAAIGVLSPAHMPPTVLDQILSKLPTGGCLVYTLNDHSLADGSFDARLGDLIEGGPAELIFKEHGPHLPGVDLSSTVYVVRRR